MVEYDDFVIQINPSVGGTHRVKVIRSPAGKGAEGSFPASLADPEPTAASAAVPGPDAATREVVRGGRRPAANLEARGRALFEALFNGDVEGFFRESCGITAGRNRRLRIRLQLDVREPSIARVAALPWELLYQAPRDRFLVRSEDITVVRELDVPVSGFEAPRIDGPVRVLFVMANPLNDLNLTAERAEIESQLRADMSESDPGRPVRREIVAEFLEHATFAQLEDLLRRKDYHVIHFMGHGAFDETHQGQLLFHDGMRSGRQLGALLAREKDTRLVTLNACRTAVGPTATEAHPFAGVASALVMAGVPAVIAMQYPVSDKAAIAFSARLYSELGRGEPIEQAVDSGRSRIDAVAPGTEAEGEWATPVLFLRDSAPFSDGDFVATVVAAEPAVVRIPTGDPWGPRDSDTFRVFVASPIRKLSSLTGAIQARLQAMNGVRVLGPPPAPDTDADTPAYTAAIRQLADGADLCVHVLGDSPGESIDDAPLTTAPVQQLDAAAASGRPVMVVMLRQALDSIVLPPYRQYVDGLRNHYSTSQPDRFELATVEDRNSAVDSVADKVTQLQSARQSPASEANADLDVNAYIDVLKTDAELADPVVTFLDRQAEISRVTRAKGEASRPPGDVEREFARVLSENQLYVVVQGGNAPWAEFRWITASKSATMMGLRALVAVYHVTPAEGDERLEIKLNMLPPDARARRALKMLREQLK